MLVTIFWRLILSLESIVILLGFGYVGLFIYNPELLMEVNVTFVGESFREKADKESSKLPAELG